MILGSDVLGVVQSHTQQSLKAAVCTRNEQLTFRVGRQDEDVNVSECTTYLGERRAIRIGAVMCCCVEMRAGAATRNHLAEILKATLRMCPRDNVPLDSAEQQKTYSSMCTFPLFMYYNATKSDKQRSVSIDLDNHALLLELCLLVHLHTTHLYHIRVQPPIPKHAQRRHPSTLPPPLIDRVRYRAR